MNESGLPHYYHDVTELLSQLHTHDEAEWWVRGQDGALRLFHEMAARVPAYKDFLASHDFSPESVRSFDDFSSIPTINKDNYLRKYSKEQLSWDGVFPKGHWTVSMTSGSTGQPYYFPRQPLQDEQYAVMAEAYLRNNFAIQDKKTLYVVAFPMGAWIGGLYTYEALRRVADKGYDLSIITPGINKKEVINAIKQLSGSFDQVIIGAYAPFLKDIIDDGARDGIDWRSVNAGFVFSAEAFTETFRDFVLDKAQSDDPLSATLNHYGTVDMGTMAHETPESVLIRRRLVEDNTLQVLFPEKHRQPTFAQYNPELFYFESADDNLICSAWSGIPLVRYELKDYGGVFGNQEVRDKLSTAGYDLPQLVASAGIGDKTWNLPYVYLYERNDFSVSYYAFQLYPDTVRRSLQLPSLQEQLTGKFTMRVDYNNEGRQELHIYIELKADHHDDEEMRLEVTDIIHLALLAESSEYRETHSVVDDIIKPIVHLLPYEDAQYFSPGTKQKWTDNKKQQENNTMKPKILREGEYDRSQLDEFLSQKIWKVQDIFESQLTEYFEIENAQLGGSESYDAELANYIKSRSEPDTALKGNYIYYPWSGLVLHTISEAEQNRLRTNRMNNLLTLDEQAKLKDFACGVAGLSFGNGIALSLVYSGAANSIKIADSDIFETTNLNRVRVGLPSVNQKKTEVTAQEIYEINPYANVTIFDNGLTEANVEDFVSGGTPLNAVFDVVDNFAMKVRLRLAAKKAGVPVIMLTSLEDSILVDVERFDLDPDADIFHGLLGSITDDLLTKEMTEQDKARYAMAIVGPEHVSYRNLSSLADVGTKLVSRPHLFGTVSIVCGIATYITKRIALGEDMPSMRRHIQFHEVLDILPNSSDTPEARQQMIEFLMSRGN